MKKNGFKYGLLIALLASLWMLIGCGKKEVVEETIVETETVEETEEIIELVQIAPDQEVINLMLVGQDRREDDGRSRSDAMILITLDRVNQTLDMTSFMRDTYVQIPEWGGNRLNAAYVFGGMDLMRDTFRENFGVEIDGIIEVDFFKFTDIINMLGGIDIEVNEDEAQIIGCEPGYVHLDGKQTLSYCRIRKVGRADFERTERQRRVLSILFDRALNMSTNELMKCVDEFFSQVTTDMTQDDLFNLGLEVMLLGIDTMGTHNIPEDAGYTSETVDGMSVLVPDLEACRALLDDITAVNE